MIFNELNIEIMISIRPWQLLQIIFDWFAVVVHTLSTVELTKLSRENNRLSTGVFAQLSSFVEYAFRQLLALQINLDHTIGSSIKMWSNDSLIHLILAH